MIVLNKILIVDDSQLIHNMYRLIMSRYQGCKILDAMNGLEALDILSRESDFDIILLDINMPVMNGIQFMEKLHGENLPPYSCHCHQHRRQGGRYVKGIEIGSCRICSKAVQAPSSA
jgi:CheY-like chemotaxis protein